MAWKTKAARRAYNVRYLAINRAKVRAQQKTWADAHQKERRQYREKIEVRFRGAKIRARQGHISFLLTFEQYQRLVRANACFYCGGALPKVGYGLDRKKSCGPYSVENCVACCADCNYIRGNDRISHCEMVHVAKLLLRLRRRK